VKQLRSHRFGLWLGTPFLMILLLIATRGWWLSQIGAFLIHNDGPAKAELAVVLAGDARGNRILKAAELVREGYVPAVLVSGPAGMYGQYECDLAIPFAVSKGYPREWFIRFPNTALSTKEEAEAILGELRRRDIHHFLLVTSDYHSGRADRIYRAAERAAGGGPDFRMVTAGDRYFDTGSWWHNREGMKIVFIEWSKTIATAMGV
jgi:uncharacterized SAM-binding protein YcdF (DUF218 family)